MRNHNSSEITYDGVTYSDPPPIRVMPIPLRVHVISNCRSNATNAVRVFAPNTFAMFSRVVGLPFVANTGVFLPFGVWLKTENFTPT